MTNDRLEVTDLVTRLYALLDEGRYDDLGSIYAEDADLEFPSGHMHGLAEITAMARRRGERYDRAQHITTDLLVDVDGDRAHIRANHWAIHLLDGAREEAGIVNHFDAARGAGGWRLTRGRGEVIWRG